jgi:hypothetical protein
VHRWRPVAVAVIVTVALTGCTTSSAFRTVSATIETQCPGVELDREMHLRLGRVSLGLVRALIRIAEDDVDDEAVEIMENLRALEVSTYRVRGATDLRSIDPLSGVRGRFEGGGWMPVVTTREGDEVVRLLTRESPSGEIREMFVVCLEDDELTVVHLEGDLDSVLAAAVADDPGQLLEFSHVQL